jgi:adenylate cyclase
MILPLVAMLALSIARPRIVEDATNVVFDGYQRLAPRAVDPAYPVRILAIDEASLARLGQWPWPRTRLAEAIDRLFDLGAIAVGIDILLAEPDRYETASLLAALPPGPARDRVAEALAGAPGPDARLAEAMRGRPVAIGALLRPEPGGEAFAPRFGLAAAGDDPKPFLIDLPGAVAPLPMLAEASGGIGLLNWLPDRDLVVRRAPLLMRRGETIHASLAVELLRVAQGAGTLIVRSSNASGETAFGARSGVNALKVGDIAIETAAAGDVRVRYSRSDPDRFVSFAALFDGQIPREAIEGRIVLVGATAAGLGDIRATPIDAAAPGVEAHAQLIEYLLDGRSLRRPDWAPAFEWLATMLVSLGLAVGATRLAPLIGAAVGAVLAAALWAASWFAFLRHGVLLDPLLPSLTGLIVYLSGLVMLFREERLRRLRVRAAFSRFVAPEVVAEIGEHPERLRLGGEMRVLTVMFADIRGFTGIAEGRSAEEVTAFVNAFLDPMSRIILAHRGTIDKYMGDAIMAFWNAPLPAPDHADRAVRCALAMLDALERLDAGWRREAEAAGRAHRPVRIGIGLSTAACCVGNLGSSLRLDYSAIGDGVNVASRLEALTKTYGAPLLASEATRAAAPGFAWRRIDAVTLAGRAETVVVHTIDRERADAAGRDAVAAG